ncbi:MAG: thiamine-phosphate kinase [Candidatus Zixiibacteriota bacterium]
MDDSEFTWIAELAARFGAGVLTDGLLGIGDDAAILPATSNWVVSADSQVSGVHFEPGWLSWQDLGRRLLHVGFSDIAAMGAEPKFALVSVEVGRQMTAQDRQFFADGIGLACNDLTARLIGGNVSARSEGFSAHVTAIGSPRGKGPLLRSGARPGDALYVTGPLGDAAAGVAILRGEPSTGSVGEEALADAYRHPRAHWREGLALAQADWVHAAIDVSDGLAADLGHLCAASGVGAELSAEAIPLSEPLVGWCHDNGRDPLEFALGGGEDYVLLFAADPDETRERELRARFGVFSGQIWRVGKITSDRQMKMIRAGEEELLPPLGHDHLAR